MRNALILMLAVTAAPALAAAQTPAAERQRAEAIERQAQQLALAQRQLEVAMREYHARLAAYSGSGSAANRNSLQRALNALEAARLVLNRQLEVAMQRQELVRATPRPVAAPRVPTPPDQQLVIARMITGDSLVPPRGWLGITLSSPWFTERDPNGRTVWRFPSYPAIESVEPGSPAERAGVAAGDVLVSIGGGDVVRGTTPFTELLRPGSNVVMVVRRGTATRRFTARVVPRPGTVTYTVVQPAASGGTPVTARENASTVIVHGTAVTTTTTAGGQSESRTVRLVPAPMSAGRSTVATVAGAELFPIRTTVQGESAPRTGLFVLKVAPATPVANAGIRSGDVIVAANRVDITSAETFRQAIESERSRRMTIVVVREGVVQSLLMRW